GRFALQDVVPGRYELEAAREGYKAKPEAAVTIAAEGAKLELHLIPLATIAGKIVDETGDPVADARVEAMTYRYVTGRKQLQSSRRVNTNDRGEYLLA